MPVDKLVKQRGFTRARFVVSHAQTSWFHTRPASWFRREWDERYGDSIARARTWRYAAFGAIFIAALAVAGVAWVGSQSKVKPFVVALDGLGNPIAMAQPAGGSAVSQRIIEAQVANLIWNARTVLSDQTAQKVLLDRVYDMLGQDASSYLNQYYNHRRNHLDPAG